MTGSKNTRGSHQFGNNAKFLNAFVSFEGRLALGKAAKVEEGIGDRVRAARLG